MLAQEANESMNETEVFICRVETPDGISDYVTLLAPESTFSKGLPAEAIVGVLAHPLSPDEAISPDIFARNRVFVDFMHEVIARHGPAQPGLQAEARRSGNDFVYIVDQRTQNPNGSVPSKDILGAFEVKDGELLPESYRRNPNHLILSPDGFFNLGAELQRCLLDELSASAAAANDKSG
jgi:hypothetical protein